ncbi:uncharacterized protein LOC113634778 isoform X6 [Tachysurus fulvidraco]|uniref:uncharacterized protein LOC113634778 isoform X6 n=1 Tax=Tachysurus fulvidraco TaxID=1234273 RepID=UPI001FED5295|nr:uncharacterized protein LOC113634778 isoform X6 [Tachysurus fulvidraco]
MAILIISSLLILVLLGVRTDEWRTISEWERLFFLIFWNISLQDSGLYNCEILTPVHTMGHVINVTVTDYNAVSTETITEGSPVTPVTDITNTHLSSEKWLYVIYFSAFVVALILAVPLMCRGLKRFLEDEDTMTTVIYEETEKSSVQD